MNQFGSFSDAILFGAMSGPQAFGAFVGPDGSTCAMGAGLQALLGRDLNPAECLSRDELWRIMSEASLFERFGYLRSEVDAPCGCEAPAGHHDWNGQMNTSKTIYNLIIHLNNFHRWSREAVGYWLRSVEDNLGFITLSEPEQSQELALATTGV